MNLHKNSILRTQKKEEDLYLTYVFLDDSVKKSREKTTTHLIFDTIANKSELAFALNINICLSQQQRNVGLMGHFRCPINDSHYFIILSFTTCLDMFEHENRRYIHRTCCLWLLFLLAMTSYRRAINSPIERFTENPATILFIEYFNWNTLM